MTLDATWTVFDAVGTVAFALSGALVGISKRMDVFGISVLALLTAVGGGIVRDILIGVTPPAALSDTDNLLLAAATAIFVIGIYSAVRITPKQKKFFTAVFYLSDTLGLAAFTVTGVIAGLAQEGARFTLPVLLGTLTAVGGGVLRDIMAQRMPTVLHADFYAVAAAAGAILITVMTEKGADPRSASLVGFITVAALRLLAIRFGWQVYHPKPKRRRL